MDYKQITANLTVEQIAWVRKLAEKENRPVNNMIRILMDEARKARAKK